MGECAGCRILELEIKKTGQFALGIAHVRQVVCVVPHSICEVGPRGAEIRRELIPDDVPGVGINPRGASALLGSPQSKEVSVSSTIATR